MHVNGEAKTKNFKLAIGKRVNGPAKIGGRLNVRRETRQENRAIVSRRKKAGEVAAELVGI